MAADRNAGRRMTNRRMFLTMVFGAVFRRRSRAIMAVVASMVGTVTLFGLAAICLTVPQQMGDEMRTYGANLIVTGPQGGMGDDVVRTVETQVRAAAEADAATYRYETVRVNAASYVLAGIDVDATRALNRHWVVDGDWPSDGQVLVGSDAAEAMSLQIGDTVTIGYRADNAGAPGDAGGGTSSEDSSGSVAGQMRDGRVSTDILETGGVGYRVAGILETGGNEDGIIYATVDDVVALAGDRGPDVIEFASQADDGHLEALADAINDGELGVSAQRVSRMTSSNRRIIAMLQTLFWFVSAVVLALTLVGVSTTMSSIVSQRRNEIGLRRALGATTRSVVAEFAAESALYGMAGGLCGVGLGYALARALCRMVFDRTLDFSVALGAASVALSVAVAVAASTPPIRNATRIDPAVVLREE